MMLKIMFENMINAKPRQMQDGGISRIEKSNKITNKLGCITNNQVDNHEKSYNKYYISPFHTSFQLSLGKQLSEEVWVVVQILLGFVKVLVYFFHRFDHQAIYNK